MKFSSEFLTAIKAYGLNLFGHIVPKLQIN